MELDKQFNTHAEFPTHLSLFHSFLDSIRVTRKGNRGHTLVGSEVHDLFKQRRLLVDLINYSSVNSRKNYSRLLNLLNEIYHLCMTARGLDDDEILRVRQLANKIGRHYPTSYPTRTITPKLHTLIYHIPEFAEKYRTIGLLSEHCIEATHAEFNRHDRLFANITDPELALKHAVTQTNLAHDTRFESFSKPQRICPVCNKPIAKCNTDFCKCD